MKSLSRKRFAPTTLGSLATIARVCVIAVLSTVLLSITSGTSAHATNLNCPSGSTLSTADNLCHQAAIATTTNTFSCPVGFTQSSVDASSNCLRVYAAKVSYFCTPITDANGAQVPGVLTSNDSSGSCNYPSFAISVLNCPQKGLPTASGNCFYDEYLNPAVTRWVPEQQITHPATTVPAYTTTIPGYWTINPGFYTIAPGYYASTGGYYTTTPGYYTTTPGYYTTTPGYYTTNPGYNSTTAGYYTTTPGYYTTTPGYYTTSSSQVWHAATTSCNIYYGYKSCSTTAGYYTTSTSQVWHPAVQNWNPPVQVWHPAVQNWNPPVQVWHPAVSVWNPPVQVWHPAVQIWHADEKVWHPEVKVWHEVESIWHPDVVVNHDAVTTPSYVEKIPAHSEVIRDAYNSYSVSMHNSYTSIIQNNVMTNKVSHLNYVCEGSDYVLLNGTLSTCTKAIPVTVTPITTYACPEGFNAVGNNDCTISPILLPDAAPSPVDITSVKLDLSSDSGANGESIAISWTIPNSNGSPITSYDLYWDGPFQDAPQLLKSFAMDAAAQPGSIQIGQAVASVRIPVSVRNPNSNPNAIIIAPGQSPSFWVIAKNLVGSSEDGGLGVLNNPCLPIDYSSDAGCLSPEVIDANTWEWANSDLGDSGLTDLEGSDTLPVVPTPLPASASASNPNFGALMAAPSTSTANGGDTTSVASIVQKATPATYASTTTKNPLILKRMMVYMQDFLKLQKQLGGSFSQTQPTIAWSTHSLYAWGGTGELVSPDDATAMIGNETYCIYNEKGLCTTKHWKGIPWKTMKLQFCATDDTDQACEAKMNMLNARTQFENPTGKKVINTAHSSPGKSPLICQNLSMDPQMQVAYIGKTPSSHPLYSYSVASGCKLPYVDCSGLIDITLKWALEDYGVKFDPTKNDRLTTETLQTDSHFITPSGLNLRYANEVDATSLFSNLQQGDLVITSYGHVLLYTGQKTERPAAVTSTATSDSPKMQYRFVTLNSQRTIVGINTFNVYGKFQSLDFGNIVSIRRLGNL